MKVRPALFALLCSSVLFVGCDDDGNGGGGSSWHYGDNDPDVVACVGDSLTAGKNCHGAPYPSRLAAMSGKRVLNFGVGGMMSDYGVSIIGSVLARKPGTVCILFGSNDAIHGKDNAFTESNLRRIVSACKQNGSRPILATPPPMYLSHKIFNHRAGRIAEIARRIAKEENVPLVDLNAAMADDIERYINSDGLHFTDEGGDFVAKKFDSKL